MRQNIFAALIPLLIILNPADLPQARDVKQVSNAAMSAPAGNRPAKIDPAGETILPNGRLITPLGKQVKVAPHP
ncbi:MAG TPA: hypothetical protein VMO17_19655, partial [Terriglobia bacterium]|nr:hypothetical protein [Terriglobia bacterium]